MDPSTPPMELPARARHRASFDLRACRPTSTPSNQLGNRHALRPCAAGGIELPRDPAQFPDPDALRLDRADNRHLAFGFGVHQCAGLSLARLEGRVAIGRFLARFPDYRLAAAPVRGGRVRFRGFLHAPFAVA